MIIDMFNRVVKDGILMSVSYLLNDYRIVSFARAESGNWLVSVVAQKLPPLRFDAVNGCG